MWHLSTEGRSLQSLLRCRHKPMDWSKGIEIRLCYFLKTSLCYIAGLLVFTNFQNFLIERLYLLPFKYSFLFLILVLDLFENYYFWSPYVRERPWMLLFWIWLWFLVIWFPHFDNSDFHFFFHGFPNEIVIDRIGCVWCFWWSFTLWN